MKENIKKIKQNPVKDHKPGLCFASTRDIYLLYLKT